MSADARNLGQLIDEAINFDFSEIDKYVGDKDLLGIKANEMKQRITGITSQITDVIDKITRSGFNGLNLAVLNDYEGKVEKFRRINQTMMFTPPPGFERYIDLIGGERLIGTEPFLFYKSSSRFGEFVNKLKKHIGSSGSAARPQRPLTSPILDEVIAEIENGNSLDIVVDGQALRLSSKDFTEYIGGLSRIFTCPISQDIMDDPVTCSDGQTYERLSVQTWFDNGNNTSPLTNTPLANTILIPNIALRQAIEAHKKLFEAKKAGAGYKRRKTNTYRKKSKHTRKSIKNKKIK